MPEGFALPDRGVQVWLPWQLSAESPRDQHYLGAMARLAAGVTIDDAQRQLARVADELAVLHPATNQGWSVRLLPLREDTVGGAAGALWMLLGAVGLLLLVACANVALLTLMRGLDRAGDTAVRLALGASAARLVREFLMESVLLAVAGGMLGAAARGGRPARAAGNRPRPAARRGSEPRPARPALRGRCHDPLGAPVGPAPGVAPRPPGPGVGPGRDVAADHRRRTSPAARRHGGGAGRAGRGAARRIGAARPQRARAGRHRSGIRSARRPGRSGVPRQPGLQQRRAHAHLLPRAVRASGGVAGRRRRRRRHDGADQPAGAGLRTAGLARGHEPGRGRSHAGVGAHGHARAISPRSGCASPTVARSTTAMRRPPRAW